MVFRKLLLESPSAWLPIAMSSIAFILLIVFAVAVGDTNQQDEGPAARIFQLLLAGQIPLITFFAIKWLPKKQKQALQILVVQLCAGFLTYASVIILELYI